MHCFYPRTLLAGLCLVSLSCAQTGAVGTGDSKVTLNPVLTKMESNKWLMLHQQKGGDKVRFRRQAHGGSCFDTKRGEFILFGSNTHSRDWKNSPFIFNVAKPEWRRVYKDDHKDTYKVTEEGLPVAGEKGDHPWATHTFGCVIYDATRDEMVIVCYPGHMRPNKWGHAIKHLWGKVKQHPNWTFNLETQTWKPLAGKSRHFFPHCAAMDTDRNVLIGCQGGRISELSGEPRAWKSVKSKSYFGWHDNGVYDSKNKALLVFGTNKNANDILIYKPETNGYPHRQNEKEG